VVVDGDARICTIVAALVDTNVLVYRFDPRFPVKQARATAVLRAGIGDGSLKLPHQAIVELVSVVTRPLGAAGPLLTIESAVRECEELMAQFEVLYPNEEVVRLALRAMPAYQLSWFDAHMWAYAEHFGLDELLSEDFQHGRRYGTVRVTNPFEA
jgi:predicted nucleic acid-binding protein